MAEYNIKVDTQAILDTASKIETQKTNMENYMSEMKIKVNELQEYFKSTAGTDYAAKYAEVTKDIQACLNNLESEITGLKNAAQIFSSKDSKVTTDVNALGKAGVFTNK